MAIDRWNPLQDMMNWREAMDRFFSDSLGQGGAGRGAMPIDVIETPDGYTVHASLPGLRPDEIQVQVSGNTLTIRGEHNSDTAPPDTSSGSQSTAQSGQTSQGTAQSTPQYLVRERRMQTVYRSITLPGAVNADAANAHFENGVLTLTLPRQATAQGRQIPISGGTASTQIGTGSSDATPSPAQSERGGALNPTTTNPQTHPVEDASEDSFPASDPPSTTMATTPESDTSASSST